jgi:hypothetical protein
MNQQSGPDVKWISSITESVSLLSTDYAREAADRWTGFAGNKHVVITVYGPMNTGKSSLIKRLLVESSAAVPEWLTSSGRPETFTARELHGGSLTFIDTPGTSSGKETHQQAAEDSLTATDALMVMWPPSLATHELAHLAEVICGDFYGRPTDGYFPAGTLIMVIGRLDTLHPDPARDVDGFFRMRDAKISELTQMLGAMGSARPAGAIRALPVIYAICADPGELVGRAAQPAAEDYDVGRAWDGIQDLRDALAELPAQRGQLRAAAAVRYWSWTAKQATERAQVEITGLSVQAREAARALTEIRLLVDDLKQAKDAAGQDLVRRIAEELDSLARIPLDGQGQAVTSVMGRLEKAVAAWETHWGSHVRHVIQSTLHVSDTFSGGPAWDAIYSKFDTISGLLDQGVDARQSTSDEEQGPDLFESLHPHAGATAAGLFAVLTGADMATAAEELRKYDQAREATRMATDALATAEKTAKQAAAQAAAQAGQAADALKQEEEILKAAREGLEAAKAAEKKFLSSARTVKTPEMGKRIRGVLRTYDLAVKVGPHVYTMGKIVKAEIDASNRERHERDRRDKLRNDLQSESAKIASVILKGWPEKDQPGLGAWCEEIIGIFHGKIDDVTVSLDRIRAREKVITAASDALNRLILERPIVP